MIECIVHLIYFVQLNAICQSAYHTPPVMIHHKRCKMLKNIYKYRLALCCSLRNTVQQPYLNLRRQKSVSSTQ